MRALKKKLYILIYPLIALTFLTFLTSCGEGDDYAIPVMAAAITTPAQTEELPLTAYMPEEEYDKEYPDYDYLPHEQYPSREETILTTAGVTEDGEELTPETSYIIRHNVLPSHNATVEYGEPGALINHNGPLWAYIRFPYSYDYLSKAVEDWALDTYMNAYEEIAKLRETDSGAEGEINIHFDSYLIDGRYAGIVENGSLMHPYLSQPRDIVRTFNMDLEQGIFLSNSDIIDPEQHEFVLELLRDELMKAYPEADGFFDNMDGGWLEHLAIGREGIIIVLERGVFLPGYLGTVQATLPYGELDSALLLGADEMTAFERDDERDGQAPSLLLPIMPIAPREIEIDPDKPMVALTFDDGPSAHTARILDLLEEHGGRATFFTVGNLLSTRSDTVARAHGMGCEIVGHSWDHKDLTKLSADEIKAQILHTNAAIYNIIGSETNFFRPPFGAVNDTLKAASRDIGFAIVNWSVDPVDWKYRDADIVFDNIMKGVHDKAIILSHDLHGSTAQAMERVIPELIAMGYQLVTVSELLSYSYDALVPGEVYRRG